MRTWWLSLSIALAWWLLAAGSALAQPADSVYMPRGGPRLGGPDNSQGLIQPAAHSEPLPLHPRSAGASRPLNRPVAPTASGAVGTVVGSLAIVLGLFVVLVWCSRRFAPAGSAQLPKEAFEILGRSALNPRQQVQLLRLGNKLLLVALTTGGAETLTEVTDPAEVERLLLLCRRGQPGSATGSFTHVLDELAREPTDGRFAGSSRQRARGAT
jgi:flagellar biogenesis protein FliO